MAQISLRIDENVKKRAEQVCSEIGISMSTAITIYLKKLSNERCIPFELSTDPFYSEANINRLEKSIENVKSGKSTLKEHELIEV